MTSANIDSKGKRTRYIKIAVMLFCIIAAFLCRFYAPASALESVSNSFFLPVIDATMALIKACAAILVFTSIVTAILSSEDIDSFKSTGGKIIIRFFTQTLAICCVTFVACFMLMNVSFGGKGGFSLGTLSEMMLSVIPDSFVDPFVENDSVQILFWAILVGLCAITIKQKISILADVFDALNTLAFKIMLVAAKLIPAIILLSIVNIIIVSDVYALIPMTQIILINFAIVLFISLVALGYVCIRWRISPTHFIKKIFPMLSFSFITASGSATMPKTFEVCEQMGIDDKLAQLWVPLSHSLYSPSFTVSTITFVMYFADVNGSRLSILQIFLFFLMIILFSMAAPKGGGGAFAITVLIADQLGIPVYDIAVLFIIDPFIKRVDCSFGMLARGLDIFGLASAEKQIDMDRYLSG